MSILEQVVQKYLNIDRQFEAQPKSIAVATSLTTILKNNPNRLAVIIINVGANNSYIGFDQNVSSTNGIFLAANGGSLSINYQQDLTLSQYEMNAISITAPSTFYVIELLAI